MPLQAAPPPNKKQKQNMPGKACDADSFFEQLAGLSRQDDETAIVQGMLTHSEHAGVQRQACELLRRQPTCVCDFACESLPHARGRPRTRTTSPSTTKSDVYSRTQSMKNERTGTLQKLRKMRVEIASMRLLDEATLNEEIASMRLPPLLLDCLIQQHECGRNITKISRRS